MKRLLLSLSLLGASALVHAQDAAPASNVLYRCTDAKGGLTLQNMPCPPGMREQKQTVGELKTAPLPGTRTSAPSGAPMDSRPPEASANSQPDPALQHPEDYRIVDSAAAPASATVPTANDCDGGVPKPKRDAPRLPPPVLFQCTTYDNDGYISEDPQPPPRRVPLQTTGLNGNPALGQGQAWELKRDTCVRVPDGKLCDAWRKRLGETEVAWRYGTLQNVDKNKAEYQRVLHIVSDSTCGQ